MTDLDESMFDSSVWSDPSKPNHYANRIKAVYGERRFQRALRKGEITDAKLERENGTEQYFQTCEERSNSINEHLLLFPECAVLADKLRDELTHGYNHLRRVEKWYKEINARDEELRMDRAYMHFTLSAYLAIRMHDIVELQTGKKDLHDSLAALFAFAFLYQFRAVLFADFRSSSGSGSMSDQEIMEIITGTAYIIQHHSQPGDMLAIASGSDTSADPGKDPGVAGEAGLPQSNNARKRERRKPRVPPRHETMEEASDRLSSNGVLDLSRLLADAQELMVEKGKSLSQYFAPFAIVETTLEQINRNEIRIPNMSASMVRGLMKQAYALAAADKLDAYQPAALASSRTALSVSDRDWFVPYSTDLSLADELSERIRLGRGQSSPCDIDRILYEITRTSPFEPFSPYVNAAFNGALIGRAEFYQKAIPLMLRGDVGGYVGCYEQFQKDTLKVIMEKAQIPSDRITAACGLSTDELRRAEARMLLKYYRYDPAIVDTVLDRIQKESDSVRIALEGRLQTMYERRHVIPDKQAFFILSCMDRRGQGSQDEIASARDAWSETLGVVLQLAEIDPQRREEILNLENAEQQYRMAATILEDDKLGMQVMRRILFVLRDSTESLISITPCVRGILRVILDQYLEGAGIDQATVQAVLSGSATWEQEEKVHDLFERRVSGRRVLRSVLVASWQSGESARTEWRSRVTAMWRGILRKFLARGGIADPDVAPVLEKVTIREQISAAESLLHERGYATDLVHDALMQLRDSLDLVPDDQLLGTEWTDVILDEPVVQALSQAGHDEMHIRQLLKMAVEQMHSDMREVVLPIQQELPPNYRQGYYFILLAQMTDDETTGV